ncbi:hypothetical protein QE152_g37328 [Popillia japonica]|uniref:Uncharacterized protein n=1 Tax=Popillia japonica TaxID=7064 RepID=A0AAW1IA55_POPJA
MVRLKKKIPSHTKMASYEVGVTINNPAEELSEITFSTVRGLKVLLIEFYHRTHLLLYLKDATVINNQSIDCVTLKHVLANGVEFFILRFASPWVKEEFLRDGFSDRLGDSGQSSSDSNSTPSPPQINYLIVYIINNKSHK